MYKYMWFGPLLKTYPVPAIHIIFYLVLLGWEIRLGRDVNLLAMGTRGRRLSNLKPSLLLFSLKPPPTLMLLHINPTSALYMSLDILCIKADQVRTFGF